MKKLTTFKIRMLAIVLMTLSLTIIISCATGQVKRKNDISSGDVFVVGNYELKVPDGYVGITSSEVPPFMIKAAKKLKKKYPSEGIYNKNVGTVILFAYLDKVDAKNESRLIEEFESTSKDEWQDILQKKGGKNFDQANIYSLALSTTAEYFTASATISMESGTMSLQFCLKRNPHMPSKKGRIMAFVISQPSLVNDAKSDMLNILNSAQEV